MKVTFANVTSRGATQVTTSAVKGSLPPGFQRRPAAVADEIETTAAFTESTPASNRTEARGRAAEDQPGGALGHDVHVGLVGVDIRSRDEAAAERCERLAIAEQ